MSQRSHPIKLDSRPLYVQAIEALRHLIDGDEYHSGDRLPSEEGLAKTLGISRSTLREAMGHLETQGLISRRQGVGTFVATPAKATFLGGMERLESLRSRAEKAGLAVETVEHRLEITPPSSYWLEAFGDDQHGKLVRVQTVESVEGKRVAFLDSYVPLALVDLDTLETFGGTVVEYFDRHGEAPISHTRSNVFAVEAEGLVAEKLQVAQGKAILHLSETYYSVEGEPLGLSRNFFLTDHFHFFIIRQVVGRGF